jgi:uncharacterized protein HemY
VADQGTRTWGDTITALLKRNADSGETPDSLRSLAAALAAQPGATQNADSWKSSLRRYRQGTIPREPAARAIAVAFGVPRSDLPTAQKMTALEVYDRLEELSASVVHLRDVEPMSSPVWAALRETREAIRLLANGDTQQALRVLSEAADR